MTDIESKSPFSPYRADGKLVRSRIFSVIKCVTRTRAYRSLLFEQYGFICVVTGATQPIGEAIIAELAGTDIQSFVDVFPLSRHERAVSNLQEWASNDLLIRPQLPPAHGAACIYGSSFSQTHIIRPISIPPSKTQSKLTPSPSPNKQPAPTTLPPPPLPNSPPPPPPPPPTQK